MIEFESSLTRLDRFIWYLVRRWERPIPGMEAHDLHQVGLIKLYEMSIDARYNTKPASEFDVIFKRTLFNALMDQMKECRVEQALTVHVDLEDLSEAYGYNAFEETYLRHYQQHLERFISPDAALLLEHLLNPTPAIYHMHEIQRMRREALRNQGFHVHIPRKLTRVLVGRTIGFSSARTKKLIRELQRVWAEQCQTVHNLARSAVTL